MVVTSEMKATTIKKLSEIGDRMRIAREKLGFSQVKIAELFGCSVRTYQKNETGLNEAGICIIDDFIRLGINANWLLTGEGEMLLVDLRPPVSPAGLDMPRLLLAIEAVEEGLEASNRTMLPDKKAELFLAVYDMMEEPTITKDRVLRLVKLAA